MASACTNSVRGLSGARPGGQSRARRMPNTTC